MYKKYAHYIENLSVANVQHSLTLYVSPCNIQLS